MNVVVTHISPDLDAFTSCWLICKYFPHWEEATIQFVPAGSTLDNKPPDKDPHVLHVDTGFGRFDHHQTDAQTCAAKLVFAYLDSLGHIPDKYKDALIRMVDFVNTIDHFGEVYYPDAASDRYSFLLVEIIEGLKHVIDIQTEGVDMIFKLLDASLYILQNKVRAELEIKKGFVFNSKWGKSLAMEVRNEEALKLAMKTGYNLVVSKDPKQGGIRIKIVPGKKLSLESLYKQILIEDKKGTWFFHASGNMLLNASAKNSTLLPSPLTLKQLIEIIKGM